MPNERGTAQIDHIVTSPFGIFVIETKHYNGWIFGSEHQKYWTQVIYKRKEKLYNPVWQNHGHIQSLKKYLGKEDNEHFYSIIAFSKQSSFKFKESFRSAKVIQIPQLIKTIKEKNEVVFNPVQLNRINYLLEQLKIENEKNKDVKKLHVRQIKQNRTSTKVLKLSQFQKCPRCGGKLYKRKGKYGSFYGCSNFPKCKYTKKL